MESGTRKINCTAANSCICNSRAGRWSNRRQTLFGFIYQGDGILLSNKMYLQQKTKINFGTGMTEMLKCPAIANTDSLAAMLQRQLANAGSSIGVIPQFINSLTKQIFTILTY
jgi:hypothetical protein